MADRTSASILIGGILPSDFVEPLLETIALERELEGWEETPIEATALDRGEPLEICGFEKAGGVFDKLEAFCVAHALPFVRISGSCLGAFGPERVVFDGSDSPRHYATDEDDRVVIDRSTLEALGSFDAARAWFDAADFTPPPLARA